MSGNQGLTGNEQLRMAALQAAAVRLSGNDWARGSDRAASKNVAATAEEVLELADLFTSWIADE